MTVFAMTLRPRCESSSAAAAPAPPRWRATDANARRGWPILAVAGGGEGEKRTAQHVAGAAWQRTSSAAQQHCQRRPVGLRGQPTAAALLEAVHACNCSNSRSNSPKPPPNLHPPLRRRKPWRSPSARPTPLSHTHPAPYVVEGRALAAAASPPLRHAGPAMALQRGGAHGGGGGCGRRERLHGRGADPAAGGPPVRQGARRSLPPRRPRPAPCPPALTDRVGGLAGRCGW